MKITNKRKEKSIKISPFFLTGEDRDTQRSKTKQHTPSHPDTQTHR